MSAIRFTRSARKHRVGRARALYVLNNAYAVVPQIRPRQPDVLMYLGDDETGRPLEVGVVVLDDGDLLVIHVMDMRQKFRDDYIAGHDGIGE